MIEHHRRRMHVSDVCMHMHVFDGMHTPSTMFEHLATLDIWHRSLQHGHPCSNACERISENAPLSSHSGVTDLFRQLAVNAVALIMCEYNPSSCHANRAPLNGASTPPTYHAWYRPSLVSASGVFDILALYKLDYYYYNVHQEANVHTTYFDRWLVIMGCSLQYYQQHYDQHPSSGGRNITMGICKDVCTTSRCRCRCWLSPQDYQRSYCMLSPVSSGKCDRLRIHFGM